MVFLFTSNFWRSRMFRKYSLFLLPVVAGILLWSCTSPTDVAANRKVTQDGPTPLQFSPRAIDISMQQAADQQLHDYPFKIEIHNTSATQSVDITSLNLKQGNRGFLVPSADLPIHLEPLAATSIPVYLMAQDAGEYIDTLVVNGDNSLSCPLRVVLTPATPYAIWITDVHFGTLSAGQTNTMTCTIHNNGDAAAVLVDMGIGGPHLTVFTLISPSLPVVINPGESLHLSVKASPTTQDPVTATIGCSINYDGTGTVDNVAQLTVNQ